MNEDPKELLKLATWFSDFVTSVEDDYVKNQNPYGLCPVCGKPGVSRCRCMLADTTCEAGHEWHFKGDEIHLGKSDHSNASNHTGCKVVGKRNKE